MTALDKYICDLQLDAYSAAQNLLYGVECGKMDLCRRFSYLLAYELSQSNAQCEDASKVGRYTKRIIDGASSFPYEDPDGVVVTDCTVAATVTQVEPVCEIIDATTQEL